MMRNVAALHAIAWTLPAGAAAFSDPLSYADPAEVGGGGGRWFTGSAADGYSCDVCHEGEPGADLSVSGLPLEGFVPGTSYEVTLAWPATTQHQALIAEFTDENRLGAGAIELPRPDTLREGERCAGEQLGFPSSDVHEFEPGRQLVSVVDCGARFLRFRWTAPVAVAGPVWFNAGFVASNEDATPAGDGVTMVRRPLVPAGTSLGARVVAQQGCSVSLLGRRAAWLGAARAVAGDSAALEKDSACTGMEVRLMADSLDTRSSFLQRAGRGVCLALCLGACVDARPEPPQGDIAFAPGASRRHATTGRGAARPEGPVGSAGSQSMTGPAASGTGGASPPSVPEAGAGAGAPVAGMGGVAGTGVAGTGGAGTAGRGGAGNGSTAGSGGSTAPAGSQRNADDRLHQREPGRPLRAAQRAAPSGSRPARACS